MTEIQIILNYLSDHVATAYMIHQATGIQRPNICRRVADLKRSKHIDVAYSGLCQVSNFRANYLYVGSDPTDHIPDEQLSIGLISDWLEVHDSTIMEAITGCEIINFNADYFIRVLATSGRLYRTGQRLCSITGLQSDTYRIWSPILNQAITGEKVLFQWER